MKMIRIFPCHVNVLSVQLHIVVYRIYLTCVLAFSLLQIFQKISNSEMTGSKISQNISRYFLLKTFSNFVVRPCSIPVGLPPKMLHLFKFLNFWVFIFIFFTLLEFECVGRYNCMIVTLKSFLFLFLFYSYVFCSSYTPCFCFAYVFLFVFNWRLQSEWDVQCFLYIIIKEIYATLQFRLKLKIFAQIYI